MDPALLGWLCFAIAVGAAALLFQRMRASEASGAALRAELDAARLETEALQKRVEQTRAEQRSRGEELAELRKKHDKLKKRAGDSLEEEKALPARIRTLEAELEAEQADARAARDEIVRLHAEVERNAAELAREQTRAAGLVPPTSQSELDNLSRRAADAEGRREKLAADLEAARHDVAKYRGRWETLDKAYVILRGELELKKDEVRAQRVELERLRTLEVVLNAPEPAAEATKS
jgi:chromosome segregation ATPase